MLRYLLALLTLLLLVTPMYKQKTSDFVIFEDKVEKLQEGFSKSLIENLKSTTDYVKSKLYEGDKAKETSEFEKTLNFVTYGFGYGYNVLGAVKKSIKFSKYKKYESATLVAAFMFFTVLFQLLALIIKKLNSYTAFAGTLVMLNLILFLGLSTENPTIEIRVFGVLPIVVLSIVLMSVKIDIKQGV